jgi:quinoprotein glucose dehydrogenase
MKPIKSLFLVGIVLASTIGCKAPNSDYQNWQVYGGSKENIRYSSLTQIDTLTVAKLEKVWEYHTGDAEKNTQIQANSIIVNRTLYGITPRLKLIALKIKIIITLIQFLRNV